MEFKRWEWKLCRRSRLLQSSLAFIRRALASISPPLGQPVRLLCFIANGHKANWLIVLVSMLLLPAVSLDLHAQEKVASHKPTRFSVSRFVASGNTLLSNEAIDAALRPYVGQDRSMPDLLAAAATLQDAYRNEGYGAVVVFVPQQSLEAGEVRLSVVEGKISEVKLSGNQEFSNENIRASLPTLKEGHTPQVTKIDAEIQLANENPAKQLQVTLVSGINPGDVEALIDVTEKNPLSILLGFNNTGTDSTGNYRTTIGIQHANLWGHDHVGSLQYQISPGELEKVGIYSAGYRWPVYPYRISIDAFYAHSDVDNGTTSTPAGPLQFAGRGDIFGLRLNKHLTRLGEYDHRLILGWDVRDYKNDCSIGVFGASACGTAGASVTVRPMSLTYTGQAMGARRFGVNLSLASNLFPGGNHGDQTDFEANRPGADAHYTVWRASGFAGATLPGDWLIEGRLSGQYSQDALVSNEQFGLGGASSVRGYQERERVGDSGFTATAEAYTPDLHTQLGITSGSLRFLAFYDYGRIANHLGAPCAVGETACKLAGAGVGARFVLGSSFSAQFDVARALMDGTQHKSGSYRGHLSVALAF